MTGKSRVLYTRVQHPVGQGSFHSGSISSANQIFNYVYDCGSNDQMALESAITTFISAGESRPIELDVVFLSHAHADHINGIRTLLAPGSGVTAKLILIPLIPAVDRLMAYAASLSSKHSDETSSFLREFCIEPEAAFETLEVDEVIVVASSGQGGYSEDNEFVSPPDALGGLSARVVGPSADPREPRGLPSDRRITDADALRVSNGKDEPWLFIPFVDKGADLDRDLFLARLKDSLKASIPAIVDVHAWVESTANIIQLVVHHADELRAAYSPRKYYNLNLTSMSLYIGPSRPPATFGYEAGTSGRMIRYRKIAGIDADMGWLACGDANLTNDTARGRFLRHFRTHLSTVHTFVLPHHGSSVGFHAELLSRTKPDICVASCGTQYKHPNYDVIHGVITSGAQFYLVNDSKLSAFIECLKLIS